MLSWNMLAAGIAPSALDNRCLKFTSSQGEELMGKKQEIAKMLANPRASALLVLKQFEKELVIKQNVHRNVDMWKSQGAISCFRCLV